jgi:hypothetical protein
MEMTVEKFLEKQCETILNDVRKHAETLIKNLQSEYIAGVENVNEMMRELHPSAAAASSSVQTKTDATTNSNIDIDINIKAAIYICVTLKCLTGPHLGQKFRLEPPEGKNSEDVFKIGRSTGKAFKDKGISLYKDKEVSTAHGKIEIRNGSVYFIDTKSTNGSALNSAAVITQEPALLKDGDILSCGGTDLAVTISTDNEIGSASSFIESASVSPTEDCDSKIRDSDNFASV